MTDEKQKTLSEEEKILREKARQALKKNKTPLYSSDDEGGVSAGPNKSKDLKKDLDRDE